MKGYKISANRQTDRQADRQTDRQAGRQTDGQAGRQAGRQAGKAEGWVGPARVVRAARESMAP